MKNLIVLGLLFLISCKSTEQVNSQVISNESIITRTENCSENGTCTLELIPNKALDFKTDEFGNLYPTINNGEKTILKYTFTKNPIENTADSNYTEIVYAELEPSYSNINLVDDQLQTIKLHFGRLCFCKGESGYFAIKNGVFTLSKNAKDSLQIDLNFSAKKIPQIISEIHETISLKSNETN